MLDSFENFKNKALRQKTISVWGLGYLGYTTILLLQKNGFKNCQCISLTFGICSVYTGEK